MNQKHLSAEENNEKVFTMFLRFGMKTNIAAKRKRNTFGVARERERAVAGRMTSFLFLLMNFEHKKKLF